MFVRLPLTKAGRGIGHPNEWSSPSDDKFLQQIEKGEHAVARSGVTPRFKEIPVQVPDTARSEITSVAAGDQAKLIVKIEKIIVDRSRGQ